MMILMLVCLLGAEVVDRLALSVGGEIITEIVLRVGEIPLRTAASATPPPLNDDVTLSEIELAEASSHVSAIQDPGLRLLFTSVISRNLRAPTPPGQGPSRVP